MDWAKKFFKTKKYAEMTMEEVSAALEKLQTDIATNEGEDLEYLTELEYLLKDELQRRELPEEYREMDTEKLKEVARHLERDIYRCECDSNIDSSDIGDMVSLQTRMELELQRRSLERNEANNRYKKMSIEQLTRHRRELEDEHTTTGKFEIEEIDIELEKREQEALFQQGNYRAMTTLALEKKDAELSVLYEWPLKRAIGDELDRRGRDYASFSKKYLTWVLKHYLLDREYQDEHLHSMIDAEIEKVKAEIDARGDKDDEPDVCYYRENPRMECYCSLCKCSCSGCC